MPAILQQVQEEQLCGHSTRVPQFEFLEDELGCPVVTYYARASIGGPDADMLESLLSSMDLSSGLAVVIDSPGGYGLTSEKIIRLCRSYSGTGSFTVLVPGRAKSAATMICMGAEKIIMGPASELGPVDPQLEERKGDDVKWFSVVNIVRTYESLFTRAIRAKGNLEPYLQQLSIFDPREIAEFKAAIELSQDISVSALKSGMLKNLSPSRIEERIKIFLEPSLKKSHGRAIHRGEAEKCKLKIERWEAAEDRWKKLYELHVRTNQVLNMGMRRCIETRTDYWTSGV